MNILKNTAKFTKRFVIVAVLIIALAGVVYVDYIYNQNGALELTAALSGREQKTTEKFLGNAEYVNAGTKTTNYFDNAKLSRNEQRKKSLETLKEIIDSVKASEESKRDASKQITELTKRNENENNIETLLQAKGFEKCVAVIGDKSISVIVSVGKDGLLPSQSAQIQDIVTSSTDISLENIKIIEIK